MSQWYCPYNGSQWAPILFGCQHWYFEDIQKTSFWICQLPIKQADCLSYYIIYIIYYNIIHYKYLIHYIYKFIFRDSFNFLVHCILHYITFSYITYSHLAFYFRLIIHSRYPVRNIYYKLKTTGFFAYKRPTDRGKVETSWSSHPKKNIYVGLKC